MFCSLASIAQVGIGTNSPNANAALDVVSTTQGILFPRMTTAQRNAISNPAEGLTIFNTDLNSMQTNIGTSSEPNWKCLGLSATGCYAKISPTVYKDFLCHNLGADTSLDPHTPVVGLQGGYVQWGKRGPTDFVGAANDGLNGFAAAPTDSHPNDAIINQWSQTAAANGSWNSGTEAAPVKVTANDPCPTGFRVPTSAEWTGVNSNNTASRTGTFSSSVTEYGVALHYGPDINTKLLTLLAAGSRYHANGALGGRGYNGIYWSSTGNSSNIAFAYNLYFNSSYVFSASSYGRKYGFSLRCIAE